MSSTQPELPNTIKAFDGSNGRGGSCGSVYFGTDEVPGAGITHREDMTRRVVACWNACDGIAIEELEIISDAGETFSNVRDRYIAQCNELLAALKPFADADLRKQGWQHAFRKQVVAARAAIAKATGQRGAA